MPPKRTLINDCGLTWGCKMGQRQLVWLNQFTGSQPSPLVVYHKIDKKVTFNGNSKGVGENGKTFGRRFGVRRYIIY